jgi:hypothetical protein
MMKATRSYLFVALVATAGLCVANLISLTGFFQSVERQSSGTSTEKRLLSQLQYLQDQLRRTDDPEQARRQIRSLEALVSPGIESEGTETFRKIYAPVISAYASKPKEAEERFLLVKKRELMEGIVNAYRREISTGRIPVRAAYLNILFDTQNSLLNEGTETERVYIRRNKERFSGLRGLTGSDQALAARVAALEGVFQSFEKGFEAAAQWKAQKEEALAAADKSLPKLARDLYGSRGQQAEDLRRFFLYSCIIALIAALAALAVFYVSHKLLKLKFYSRTDSFLRLLREFGRERLDSGYDRELAALKADPDWSRLAGGIEQSESDFVASFQTHLAIAQSMTCPHVVIGRDKVVRSWNASAGELFGMADGQDFSMEDLIRSDNVSGREGDPVAALELIRGSFSVPEAGVFEISLKAGDSWMPFELLCYPVLSGPLAGGKVFLFREIRNEAERVEKSVKGHLGRIRDSIHKLTHGYEVELTPRDADAEAIKGCLEDLSSMKRKLDERELLWKSETGALIDQVSRQREILERVTDEIGAIRAAHGRVLQLVGGLHGGDENWHDEVCLLDRELGRWKALRERLEADVGRHGETLGKARVYEREIRSAAEEMEGFLAEYETSFSRLEEFSEEARVHAVNMGFVKDPGYREFAARSRAFAHEVTRFVEQTKKLSAHVKAFLAAHPASALAPHLEGGEIDPELLSGLRKEEARLEVFLKRWMESGKGLVAEGEEALGILRETDKKGAVLTQLGETSLLINDQARGNLERWS